MQRNLNGRVEVLTPVEDAALKARIEEIIATLQADNVLAWEMVGEGRRWDKIETAGDPVNTHERLEQLARDRATTTNPVER